VNWFVKAYALLHDPPYKAVWPLGYKFYDGKTHEEEAHKLLFKILSGTPLGGGTPSNEVTKVVKGADRLASSFDRWALAPEEEARYWVKPSRLINPFNPSKEREIKMPNKDEFRERVEKFVKEVNAVLRLANSEKEAYMALYATYELAWINHGLPALPADTRIPTHTIFDHLYATATVLNWVDEDGKPRDEGCLMEIDIPGIQKIIASARKAGDYRAGSLLVSLAIWGTAWKYMEAYGPDVLISPTPRFNPFLYLQLRKSYGNWGNQAYRLYASVIGKALNLPKKIPITDFIERAPVIPGTAYLALPNCDEANKALDYFEEALDAIRRLALGEETQLPLSGKTTEDILRIAGKVLDKMPRRYLPLRIRTAAIREVRERARKARESNSRKLMNNSSQSERAQQLKSRWPVHMR